MTIRQVNYFFSHPRRVPVPHSTWNINLLRKLVRVARDGDSSRRVGARITYNSLIGTTGSAKRQ